MERFECRVCPGADWNDLDVEAMEWFVRAARECGGRPSGPGLEPRTLLARLNLVTDGLPTNAAVLLFGSAPHRFIPSAEIECAHLHGVKTMDPIRKTFRGGMLSLVEAATTFVMSRLDSLVGQRSEGPRAPRFPEIPVDAVVEALVNAVAHRDYTSSIPVRVTLFRDCLRVSNPGGIPYPLTVDDLFREHRSVARNPLLLSALSRTEYVEETGTGTLRLIASCRRAGLPPPVFVMAPGFVAELSRRRCWDMRHKGSAYYHVEDLGKQWREDLGQMLGRIRRSPAKGGLKMEDS